MGVSYSQEFNMSSRDKCVIRGKTAYAMEKMVADGKTFHKTCMKCAHCNKTLGLGNFASLGDKYYCKPHFKQLFAEKGNYSDGFGEENPQPSGLLRWPIMRKADLKSSIN